MSLSPIIHGSNEEVWSLAHIKIGAFDNPGVPLKNIPLHTRPARFLDLLYFALKIYRAAYDPNNTHRFSP